MKKLIFAILFFLSLNCCSRYTVKNIELSEDILVRIQGFADDIIKHDSVTKSEIDSLSRIYKIELPSGKNYLEAINYWLKYKDNDISYCNYTSKFEDNKQNVYLLYSNSCYHFFFFNFIEYDFIFDFTLNDRKIIFNHLGYRDNNIVK